MIVLLLLATLLVATPAAAMDADTVFAKGTFVLTGEVGGGWQDNLSPGRQADLEFFNVGVRFSLLPWAPFGGGPLRGSLEIGLEPFYQGFVHPEWFHMGGLKAVVRYHFLSLGRVVPYVELLGGASGTDLDVPEVPSAFNFVLEGGVGLSVFVTDTVAVSLGYRYHHISNGNTAESNRGVEAHMAMLGVSWFVGKAAR